MQQTAEEAASAVLELLEALARSSERIGDLFRAWDDDKSGTVDKKEWVRAIKALGFDDSQAERVFDQLDDDRSGYLKYEELNEELRRGVKAAKAASAHLTRGAENLRDDGRGAKVNAKNMNANWGNARVAALPPTVKLDKANGSIQDQLANALAEHSVKLIDLFRDWDDDGNGAVDKKEFRKAIAALGYDAPKKEVDAVFNELDDDGAGAIEYAEFKRSLNRLLLKAKSGKTVGVPAAVPVPPPQMQQTAEAAFAVLELLEALVRSSERIGDLFRAWDDDKSGTVDKKEWVRAIKALGFDDSQAERVFDQLDDDRSGYLKYEELNEELRRGVKAAKAASAHLTRGAENLRDDGRGAKVNAKNMNANWGNARVAALPPTVKLDKANGSIQDQLANALAEHSVKLIDLFRDWDDDGNGAVDKKEFRKAIAALGYDAPKKEVDAVFDELDDDGAGAVEFAEFKRSLNRLLVKAKANKADKSQGAKQPPRAHLLTDDQVREHHAAMAAKLLAEEEAARKAAAEKVKSAAAAAAAKKAQEARAQQAERKAKAAAHKEAAAQALAIGRAKLAAEREAVAQLVMERRTKERADKEMFAARLAVVKEAASQEAAEAKARMAAEREAGMARKAALAAQVRMEIEATALAAAKAAATKAAEETARQKAAAEKAAKWMAERRLQREQAAQRSAMRFAGNYLAHASPRSLPPSATPSDNKNNPSNALPKLQRPLTARDNPSYRLPAIQRPATARILGF